MQRFPIERGNHPVNRDGSDGLLESGDLRATDSGLAPLQLNETEINSIGVAFADSENDRVHYASAWRAGFALKECNTPTVLGAVGFQSLFAGRFRCAGFDESTHALFRLNGFPRSGSPSPGSRGLLCWREFFRHSAILSESDHSNREHLFGKMLY
jgi:hypothetical protein